MYRNRFQNRDSRHWLFRTWPWIERTLPCNRWYCIQVSLSKVHQSPADGVVEDAEDFADGDLDRTEVEKVIGQDDSEEG